MKDLATHEAGLARQKREVHRIRIRLIAGIVLLILVTAVLLIVLLR